MIEGEENEKKKTTTSEAFSQYLSLSHSKFLLCSTSRIISRQQQKNTSSYEKLILKTQ